jgi:hypothetical protein
LYFASAVYNFVAFVLLFTLGGSNDAIVIAFMSEVLTVALHFSIVFGAILLVAEYDPYPLPPRAAWLGLDIGIGAVFGVGLASFFVDSSAGIAHFLVTLLLFVGFAVCTYKYTILFFDVRVGRRDRRTGRLVVTRI